MTSERPPRGMQPFTRQLAMVMELPFLIVGAVVVGGLFGFLLDRWLGTPPAFLLILGAIGFYAGLREMMRRLNDVRGKNVGKPSRNPPEPPATG